MGHPVVVSVAIGMICSNPICSNVGPAVEIAMLVLIEQMAVQIYPYLDPQSR